MLSSSARRRSALTIVSIAALISVAGSLLTVAPAAATSVGGLRVSVAYVENIGNSAATAANFPNPWSGAPNTLFLGSPNPQTAECGTAAPCYDAGAIRLDNTSNAPVKVDSVVVDVHNGQSGGKLYNNLWGSFTVAAGQSVILTENPPATPSSFDNFDTSDTPHGSCAPNNTPPTIKLTIGGAATTLVDSTHVLDTHAIDTGACPSKRNESIQWRQLGAPGTDSASLRMNPPTATQFVGNQVGVTATLYDSSGVGLPNATLKFDVISGPNTGVHGSTVTDTNGNATFTYTGAKQGEDVLLASTGVVGSMQSNQTTVMWTSDSAVGWTAGDVGSPAPAGSSSFNTSTGTWTLKGGGDIGGTADDFQFVSQPAANGGGITARVATQDASNPAAKAALLLRADRTATSAYYGALVTPGGGIQVQYRATAGGATATRTSFAGAAPGYLWVSHSGTSYSTYTSSDGYNWLAVPGAGVSLSLGSSVVRGLAASSHTSAATSTDTFDNVALPNSAPPPPPAVTCPGPWTCHDVGAVAVAGSASASGGNWTINGSGADIHNAADQFQFVYRALAGDGSISAHLTSLTNTSAWAKAGVMLRGSTDPGAPNYAALITPGNGVQIQYRLTQGASTTRKMSLSATAPAYLKVGRLGTVFTAYTSPDGLTWTAVPNSSISIPALAGSILEGLAITSHSGGTLGTLTADTLVAS